MKISYNKDIEYRNLKDDKFYLMTEKNEALIYSGFKMGLNQDECLQHRQLAYGKKAFSPVKVHRWFIKFRAGRNSLLNEEP